MSAGEPGGRPVDWSQWSVILLKPDCVARGLTGPVLGWVSRIVTVTTTKTVSASEEQIFAHYDDLFPREAEIGVDVAAELRRIYLGREVMVVLGHGQDAPARLRALLGPTDPAIAGPDTIRGHFGIDSLACGQSEGRLIDNLIHTSDDPAAACRDFTIWFGGRTELLSIPHQRTENRA
jgi:nucleoside-diphosphate kinase